MPPPPVLDHAPGRALTPVAGRAALPRPSATGLAGLVERGTQPKGRLVVDLIGVSLAALLALLPAGLGGATLENLLLALLFAALVLVAVRGWRSPDRLMNVSTIDSGAHVLGAVSLAAMLTIATDSIFGGHHPVTIALRLWLFTLLLLGIARMAFVFALRRARMNLTSVTRTLVVGAGIVGEHVVRRLMDRPEYGLLPVGVLDADPPPAESMSSVLAVPLLGGPENLAEAVQLTGAKRVVLAFSAQPDRILVEVIRRCQELGLEVSLVPRFYELVNERATLDHLGGLPLLTLSNVNPKGWQFVLKHCLDRAVALGALIVLSPLLLGLALAVRFGSPGPILFRQRRVGRDGRVFDLFKFRTMIPPGEIESFVPSNGSAPGGIEGADRRTRVGRWLRDTSLDELPQLLNVLRGEMSLVGPRPERPEFVDLFVREVNRYEDRHRVKSGITGWAQVHGLRGQTSIADRVEWDNYYVRNWSPRLDMRILALTAIEVTRFREGK
jgi:exopolysaccharide biosynthesis polyprenyl glycosylphosphotransferase